MKRHRGQWARDSDVAWTPEPAHYAALHLWFYHHGACCSEPARVLDQKFTYLEISRLFGTQFSWGWVSSSLQSPVPRSPGPASEIAEMSVQFDVSVRSRTCLVLYLYRRPGSSQLLCSMSRVVFFPAQNVLHYVLMCDTKD